MVTTSDVDHPTIPWAESVEKTRILIALRAEKIARRAKTDDGRPTTSLDDVWARYCPSYLRRKLPSQLATLRKIVDKEMSPTGFKEPGKWRKSNARKLLERDIRDRTVPAIEPQGGDWEHIYMMHSEYAWYDDKKFEKRLKDLRKEAAESSTRARDDEAAFHSYVTLHPSTTFSYKGYDHWQGSEAQKVIWDDIDAGKHKSMRKQDLYGLRREYYEYFPLAVIRDNLRQEIKTEKYRHTLQVHGKGFKSS